MESNSVVKVQRTATGQPNGMYKCAQLMRGLSSLSSEWFPTITPSGGLCQYSTRCIQVLRARLLRMLFYSHDPVFLQAGSQQLQAFWPLVPPLHVPACSLLLCYTLPFMIPGTKQVWHHLRGKPAHLDPLCSFPVCSLSSSLWKQVSHSEDRQCHTKTPKASISGVGQCRGPKSLFTVVFLFAPFFEEDFLRNSVTLRLGLLPRETCCVSIVPPAVGIEKLGCRTQ